MSIRIFIRIEGAAAVAAIANRAGFSRIKYLAPPPLSLVRGLGQAVPPGAGFDVISVRRNISGAMPEVTPPLQYGRLRFTNATVQAIMSLAFYPLDFAHIKGSPAIRCCN